MNSDILISFCGDTCSECPRYLATQANDSVRLHELAELWFRLGFRTEVVGEEEIRCDGCSRNKPCTYGINSCPHIASVNSCGECRLYPCPKIEEVFARTEKVNNVCMAKCTPEEYAQLRKAFLMKHETLDEIHHAIAY